MFFRETREKEEDIRRMFYEVRENMRMRIKLKKKSDPEQFAIPCTVKGIEFPHALCNTGASVSILPRVMAGGAFAGIVYFCGLFLEELKRNCERSRGADW